MTMTKKDIFNLIHGKLGLSSEESTCAVETTFEIIKQELEKGNKVSINGFGKWTTRDKKPRRGRNPKTGKEMIISGRRVVSFHSSNILKIPLGQKSDINGIQQK